MLFLHNYHADFLESAQSLFKAVFPQQSLGIFEDLPLCIFLALNTDKGRRQILHPNGPTLKPLIRWLQYFPAPLALAALAERLPVLY